MNDRRGKFAGDEPIEIARRWFHNAELNETNDYNAVALSTVDAQGLPNVRMVLLKDINADSFVFFTNYMSRKSQEIEHSGKVAFVAHWKSIRRQVRVRGIVEREDGPSADDYFASRSLKSRIGAWASRQSQPLASRDVLLMEVAKMTAKYGQSPPRPAFWGGFRIRPLEIEFWADGMFRLHDRFVWRRETLDADWVVQRLNP